MPSPQDRDTKGEANIPSGAGLEAACLPRGGECSLGLIRQAWHRLGTRQCRVHALDSDRPGSASGPAHTGGVTVDKWHVFPEPPLSHLHMGTPPVGRHAAGTQSTSTVPGTSQRLARGQHGPGALISTWQMRKRGTERGTDSSPGTSAELGHEPRMAQSPRPQLLAVPQRLGHPRWGTLRLGLGLKTQKESNYCQPTGRASACWVQEGPGSSPSRAPHP